MQNKEVEKALNNLWSSTTDVMFNALYSQEQMQEDLKVVLNEFKNLWRTNEQNKQYIDQLENKVKELEKENNKLTYARNWYFENTVNKLVTPEMLHKILRTKYIGRDKVENKIKELNLSGGSNGKDETENQIREFAIEVLQELLEEY